MNFKKLICLLLAVVMTVSVFATTALAAEGDVAEPAAEVAAEEAVQEAAETAEEPVAEEPAAAEAVEAPAAEEEVVEDAVDAPEAVVGGVIIIGGVRPPVGTCKPSKGIKMEDATVVYDGECHTIVPTVNVHGKEVEVTNVEYYYFDKDSNLSTEAPTEVGVYTVFADFKGECGYKPETLWATLTIVARDVTVCVDSAAITYGDEFDAKSVKVTVANDVACNPLVVGEAYVVETPDYPHVGAYQLMVDYVEDPNYNVTVVAGTLCITARKVKVQVQSMEKVYGEPIADLSYLLLDVKTGDVVPSSARKPDVTLFCAAGEDSPVGKYPIVAKLGQKHANDDYEVVKLCPGVLTVIKRPVYITIADAEKVYGQKDPEFSYSIAPKAEGSGLVKSSEELAVKNAMFWAKTLGTKLFERVPGEDVGGYAICFSDAAKVILNKEINCWNYDVQVTPGVLTITPRSLTVKIDNQTKVYGNLDPELTCEVTGVLPSDKDCVKIELVREPGEVVGTYAICIDPASVNPNYNVVEVNEACLTITQRPVVLYIVGATKTYGDADPDLNTLWCVSDATPIVEGDDLNVVISREPGETVGAYPITIDVDAINPNYCVESINKAALEIVPLEITATWQDTIRVADGESGPTVKLDKEQLPFGDEAVIIYTPACNGKPGEYTATVIVKDKDGNDAGANYIINNPETLFIIAGDEEDVVTENMGEHYTLVFSDLTDANVPDGMTLEQVVADMKKAAKLSDKATNYEVKDASLYYTNDVTGVTCRVTGEARDFTLPVPAALNGKAVAGYKFKSYHMFGDGEQKGEVEYLGKSLNVHVDSFSPFMVVYNKKEAPAPDDNTPAPAPVVPVSPKTGVNG